MKLIAVVLLLFAGACGNSPILNHATEADGRLINTALSESDIKKFQKTDYEFIISWEEGPHLGESKFLIKSWNKKTGSVNGPYQDLPLSLHVYLWMPAMGHGSAPVKITKINEGEYKVTDAHFIMGGLWEIRFQLKDGSQIFDETFISTTI